PFQPGVMSARGLKPWSANVHIFNSPNFRTWHLPNRPDVAVTGRAYDSPEPVSERLLRDPLPRSETASINILLYHGFFEGYNGADAAWQDKVTAPFSLAELKQQNFTYTALGHCHQFLELRAEGGLLLGAYSGSAAGRNFDELGPRLAILGT